jgi:hypothetical protein
LSSGNVISLPSWRRRVTPASDSSNELGEFESGVTAAWLGPERAVVVGGLGTILIVLVWSLLFRELREVDKLS